MTKKNIKIIFKGEAEVEVEEGYEIEDLRKFLYDFDRNNIELDVMGYFEDGKCDAHLNFSVKPRKGAENPIYGNNI